jgi:hypothetical protein
MPAYKHNESIEGEKISGDSRDPLRFKRIQKIRGKKHYIFKAEFNVHAKITSSLPSDTVPIDKNALIKPGDSLSCDTAVITSTSKNFSSVLESNFTSTHSGNVWEFSKQTNVKVGTPRQQIIDALQKRLDTRLVRSSLLLSI